MTAFFLRRRGRGPLARPWRWLSAGAGLALLLTLAGTAQAQTITSYTYTGSSQTYTDNLASTSTCSRWTVSNAATPLPVQLVAFTAEAQGPDVLLRWATASELRNDRFEVESSGDGRSLRRLGAVPGHGTTATASTYQWLEKNLARYAAPVVYYRLRQVDLDGTSTYSPVRPVQVATLPDFAAQLYPNASGPTDELTLLQHTRQAGPAPGSCSTPWAAW